jgi:hypothetical protein
MADKDITIKIKAVGAEQSAAEIDKIPVAIDKVDKASEKLDKSLDVKVKTTGADAAAKDLDKVDKASEKLDKSLDVKVKTTGADAAAKDIDKVDKATRKAEVSSKILSETQMRQGVRALEAVSDKARVAEFAYYDLNEEVKRGSVSLGTFSSGQTKVSASTRNSSQALLMFSQGFEDAQYGIRGVLNNIPGLVIALGGTMGLAGGISIAAVALSQLGPLFSATGESAEELKNKAAKTAETIKEVATNMGELEGERFDAVIQEFDDLRAASEAVKDQTDLTKAADRALAVSALDNATKQEQAIRNLIAALGLQLDKLKELKAIADAEQAKRELTAAQAIEIEQEKLAKAQEAQTTASDILGTQEASLNVEKGRLVALQARLEALRKERDELTAMAKLAGNDYPGYNDPTAGQRIADSQKGKQAQTRLDSQDFQSELEGTLQRVEELSAKIETQERAVTAMGNALSTSIQLREDTEAAVGTKIQELNAGLEASTLVAQSEELLKTQEATAQKLTEVYGQIETTNAAGEAAKQTILAAAADGKVTAAEQKSIADDVRVIIGQIQSGQAATKGNLQELINLQKQMAAQAANDAALIRQHSAQINQLFQRLR